jgi:hypothetical protein
MAVVAAGDVSDITPSIQLGMRQAVADEVGVPETAVTLTVSAASVLLTFEVALPASVSVSSAQSALSTKLATPAAASSFLAVTVESIAEAPQSTLPPLPPPPSAPIDASSSSPIIIIAAAGGGGGLIVCGFIIYMMGAARRTKADAQKDTHVEWGDGAKELESPIPSDPAIDDLLSGEDVRFHV